MNAKRVTNLVNKRGLRTRRKIGDMIAGPQPLPEPEKHVPGQTFSAHGEDVIAISYLMAQGLKYKDIRYLDVGAAEPSRLSNTYLLYLRGAKGVLVEPDPFSASVLRKERPRDTVVEAGVAFGKGKPKPSQYFRFNQSVFNTFSKEQAERVQEQSLGWGKGKEVTLLETLEIPLIPLNKIIEDHFGGKSPNFISIDTESVDWDILTSLNFKKYRPNVICFEGAAGQHLVDKNILTELGYTGLCRTPDNFIYARDTWL